MKSVLEIIYDNGTKTFKTSFEKPGLSKTIFINDEGGDEVEVEWEDQMFPPPRQCLLRKWPNFESGFGFSLFIDLFNSTGALKVRNVIKHSPADVGGLKLNDVVVEINGQHIEELAFIRLVEIFKHAFARPAIELLVLSEYDAIWYKERNIKVNSSFPNIQYCETPYYGFVFHNQDLEGMKGNDKNKVIKINLSKSLKNENHKHKTSRKKCESLKQINKIEQDELSFNFSHSSHDNKSSKKDEVLENDSKINHSDLLHENTNDDNSNKCFNADKESIESNKLPNNEHGDEIVSNDKITKDEDTMNTSINSEIYENGVETLSDEPKIEEIITAAIKKSPSVEKVNTEENKEKPLNEDIKIDEHEPKEDSSKL